MLTTMTLKRLASLVGSEEPMATAARTLGTQGASRGRVLEVRRGGEGGLSSGAGTVSWCCVMELCVLCVDRRKKKITHIFYFLKQILTNIGNFIHYYDDF
jgi:hypothetical protein